MKLGQHLVHYRKIAKLSQEDLAEQIYVTRQTISNWENNHTYPDVQSLILLSQIFQVSLDDLIKGDLEEMKTIVQHSELKQFDKDTYFMLIGMLSMMLTGFPLVYFLEWWGVLILVLQFLPTIYFANRIERFKNKYDVQTYKEILAVSNGHLLDSLQKQEEKAKAPYQKPLILLMFALISATIVVLVAFITLKLFPLP